METPFSINPSKHSELIRPSGKEAIPLGSGIITQLLGNGGMASVYEIWNNQLEVYHAVKLLHPNCSKEALERFQTEIKITAKLHHPYIIEIHGVGEWNGLPYIEMEKADGTTLEELIQLRGALPAEVCIAVGIMVAKALEYAHGHEYVLYNKKYNGIIHRDLKPGNIMVCKDGTVKLMDFGIARPTDTSFHTIDGAVIGTLQYLSPEQLEANDLDVTTDIYSLGICLYEMACGYLAFPENNITHLLSDKSKNRYRSLSDYDLKLPNHLDNVIQLCMTHDKNRRIQSASILSNELEKIYNKMTQDKPEITIQTYLTTPFNGRAVPKLLQKRASLSKLTIALIVIFITLLYAILIISKKKSNIQTNERTKIVIENIKPTIVTSNDSLKTQKDASSEKSSGIQPHSKQPSISGKKKSVNSDTKKSLPLNLQDIERLKLKYDTNDMLLIVQKEIQIGHFTNALSLLDGFDAEGQKSIRAHVLKARALKPSNYKEFSTFILSSNISEAELLIEKSKLLIEKGNLSLAESVLEKATTAPREIISPEQVSNMIYYYKAITLSKRFDEHPGEDSWKAALGAWYIVKKEMRSQPSHEFYKKADEEITRIGKMFRAIKG